MRIIGRIFLTAFSISMMTVVFVNRSTKVLQSNSELPDTFDETSLPSEIDFEQKIYRFTNLDLAYKVFSELDVFLPNATGKIVEKKVDSAFLGLTKREDYCDKHRAYLVQYPEFIFDEMNFLIEESPASFLRSKALKPLGNDVHPKIGSHMILKDQDKQLFNLRPFINIFFTKNDIHPYMDVGKHFSCLTQEYNHIPGHSYLARKDLVAKSIMGYAENFKDRPACFNYNKFFPQTWLLHNKEQCQEFFNKLNSEEYKRLKAKRRIVYIRKVGRGSHRGEGVQPVTEEEEKALRSEYDNGKNCGKVVQNYIVQNYVHNPLLLDGHKFDFRMYMLIASTNPLMAYYHDGFLRVTLAAYDVNSDEKKVLLTNLALNKQIYDDVKDGKLYEGKDEESLKLAQQWSFDRLQTYLLENGIINDENWLDNYLRPEFKKAMVHLLRATSGNFENYSPYYELYGVDFMLDSNLNLWFIEANSGPAFKGYSEPMEKFVLGMLKDHFEIITGLLKSRMKRIVTYVNELIDDGFVQDEDSGKVTIDNLDERRERFQEITHNYFEEEFEPKPTNGFSKIIDENYYGVQRYRGLIREECL